MKSTLFYAALAWAATTYAQDLPECVTGCIALASAGAGCTSSSDIACFCTSATFLEQVATCYATSCDAADIQTAVASSLSLCSQYGYTVSIPPAASSALAAATGGAGTVDASTTTSLAASSISSGVSSAISSGLASSTAMSSSESSTSPNTAPASSSPASSGAQRKLVLSGSAIAGVAGLVFAFL